jgi:hypothetical protein
LPAVSEQYEQLTKAQMPRKSEPVFDLVFHCAGGSLAANKVIRKMHFFSAELVRLYDL